MAVPPPPPNIHSYKDNDPGLIRALLEWVWAYYRSTVLEGFFASNAQLLAFGQATRDLIDPVDATAASAQATANDALTLATVNDGRLDTAEPDITTAQSTADDAQTDATQALSDASDAQNTADTNTGSINSINNNLADIQAGTITISGAATTGTAVVSFTDTAYHVVYGALSSTGTPAAGAFTPVSTGKTTIQITITVSAAPGGGNSVTFDFIAKRP